MKMSQIFSQTLRDNPSEAETSSHQLLLRGGFISQLAAGIFTLLPLGLQIHKRLVSIFHEELAAIGGQEILMPVVNPAEIWIQSGRYQSIDAELSRFKDRNQREMVLAMTNEEVVADLIRRQIHSYRQLPRLIYHIQTKWRDDPRPRAGLIRAREFVMKDSYSLDLDKVGLDRQYLAHQQAYLNIFHRCGLDVIAVAGDVGMMGGYEAHEFMYLTPIGEDTLLLCTSCDYAANRQVARFRKPASAGEAQVPLEKVATPESKTIQALADYLQIPQSKTAKAVFLMAEMKKNEVGIEDRFVFAIVRGDMEANETKLAQVLNARSLRPATEDEIRSIGAEPGYASPVNLEKRGSGFICVVDELIPQSKNLVSGANEAGFHFLNVNYARDFQADIVADITAAQDGDPCPLCDAPMKAVRGVEVGNIFKLGTRFSDALGCTYLDKDGDEKPVVMGSYGIGLGRLIGCIADAYHDENGLMWPVTVAPYQVHLVLLAGKQNQESAALISMAEGIYHNLSCAGIDVLFDDRDESPGVKFKDADLIGLPLRLTLSERSLQNGGVELKKRDQSVRTIIGLEGLVDCVKDEIVSLHAKFTA